VVVCVLSARTLVDRRSPYYTDAQLLLLLMFKFVMAIGVESFLSLVSADVSLERDPRRRLFLSLSYTVVPSSSK
jgi:hypothetical protein